MATALNITALRHLADYREAAMAGISRAAFYRWQNNQGDVSASQVVALAAVVGMKVQLVDKNTDDLDPTHAVPQPGSFICTLSPLPTSQHHAPVDPRPVRAAGSIQPKRSRYSDD